MSEFGSLSVQNPIANQDLGTNGSKVIDVSNVFSSQDGSYNISLKNVSDPSLIDATLENNSLTLKSNSKQGVCQITIEATSGSESVENQFSVTVLNGQIDWHFWGENFLFENALGIPNSTFIFATDFNFEDKSLLPLGIKIGMKKPENNLSWKIVKFSNGTITDEVIGDLQGSFDILKDQEETFVPISTNTKVTGHVALIIESAGNYCAMDKQATTDHTWVYSGQGFKLLSEVSSYGGSWLLKLGTDASSAIDDEQVANKNVVLLENYPNPFNPTTTLNFTIPSSGNVKLSVYNAKGELVSCLVDGHLSKGVHSVKFDGSQLNSGTYIYRIETSAGNITKKMVLLK